MTANATTVTTELVNEALRMLAHPVSSSLPPPPPPLPPALLEVAVHVSLACLTFI